MPTRASTAVAPAKWIELAEILHKTIYARICMDKTKAGCGQALLYALLCATRYGNNYVFMKQLHDGAVAVVPSDTPVYSLRAFSKHA